MSAQIKPSNFQSTTCNNITLQTQTPQDNVSQRNTSIILAIFTKDSAQSAPRSVCVCLYE